MEDSTTALALVKSERNTTQECESDRKSAVETEVNHFQAIFDFISYERIPSGHTFETFSRLCSAFNVINGVLHKGSRNPKRVVIDTSEKNDILYHYHIDQSSGLHKSVEETAKGIEEQFFWRSILQDTKTYINKCSCLEATSGNSCPLTTWTHLGIHS